MRERSLMALSGWWNTTTGIKNGRTLATFSVARTPRASNFLTKGRRKRRKTTLKNSPRNLPLFLQNSVRDVLRKEEDVAAQDAVAVVAQEPDVDAAVAALEPDVDAVAVAAQEPDVDAAAVAALEPDVVAAQDVAVAVVSSKHSLFDAMSHRRLLDQ